jgi:hypothetical protein
MDVKQGDTTIEGTTPNAAVPTESVSKGNGKKVFYVLLGLVMAGSVAWDFIKPKKGSEVVQTPSTTPSPAQPVIAQVADTAPVKFVVPAATLVCDSKMAMANAALGLSAQPGNTMINYRGCNWAPADFQVDLLDGPQAISAYGAAMYIGNSGGKGWVRQQDLKLR